MNNNQQGWYNTTTQEIGAFDKNRECRKYTLLEKLKLWWNRPNYNSSQFWEYHGTATIKRISYIDGKIIPIIRDDAIYINHILKRVKSSSGAKLDYNALINDDKIVFLK